MAAMTLVTFTRLAKIAHAHPLTHKARVRGEGVLTLKHIAQTPIVIPAKAGIQTHQKRQDWTPASAGVTV
jgi:hypothetical protein